MNERYSILFSIDENLYCETSPIIISKGVLLKDNESGEILVQLKLQNISNQIIKAVTVDITLFDTTGKQIGSKEYQYLDLNASRDIFFASEEAIKISKNTTRAYSVVVTDVVFDNNLQWKYTNQNWCTLPTPKLLANSLKSSELIKQYLINFGSQCKYALNKHSDLWICTCGSINNIIENKCHNCNLSINDIENCDLDKLEADANTRIQSEKNEQIKKQAKIKKIIKICAICSVSFAIIVIAFLSIKNIFTYNNAVKMLEIKDYNNAISTFEKLDDYKDSEKRIEYIKGMQYLESNNYAKASEIFNQLKGYLNVNELLIDINYMIAKLSYSNGVENVNITFFDGILNYLNLVPDDYKDTSTIKKEIKGYIETIRDCNGHYAENVSEGSPARRITITGDDMKLKLSTGSIIQQGYILWTLKNGKLTNPRFIYSSQLNGMKMEFTNEGLKLGNMLYIKQ